MLKLTKRLLCIGLVVVLAVAVSFLASANFVPTTEDTLEPVCYEHGDVNGDGYVDNQDAIYTLYSYLFGQEEYPIGQVWDFDKDGFYDNLDAIHLLYSYLFPDDPDYALEGTVHSYYDPSWVWDDVTGTAQVTFKCGCGTPSTYTVQNGVTVAAGESVPATCVSAGSQTYVASITVDGSVYTNTYVKTLPAGNGHSMSGEPDCENGSDCSLCDYSVPALGHSWTLESTQGATCTENAVQIYRCGTCGKTDEVEQAGTAGHKLNYLEDRQDGCKYVKWYTCANCDHTEAGAAASDTYYNHTYTATLTKEATCVSTGVKTYACVCGEFYTEEIPANGSHNWVEGATEKGVTTHSCTNSGCDATKTTVAVTEETQLTMDALANELQLNGGAAMSLDEDTVAALDADKTIVVSVTPLEEGDALLNKLSESQKEQIGNNTVYDFNMAYSNGEKISEFGGAVTISLPYTLEEGEDVDSIDVWYIDDDGNATQVTGTYSNGFVTFTTEHFSYYTVTRLTPAERCGRYGHIMVTAKKAATCTREGFDMSVCQRCGHVEKDEVLARMGHEYNEITVAATCTTAGSYEKTCTRSGCGHKVTGVIPALRHDMQKDDTLAVAPSCTAAGKEVYVCSREGCDHTREDAIAQLSHNYETVTVKAADCANKGYAEKKCSLCEDVIYTDETLPLGHTYTVSYWEWSSDHLSAEVVLECTNDKTHTKTLTAVVTQQKNSATCSGSGTVIYTATASFNQVSYTDTYTQSSPAIGHTPGAQWVANGNEHYHICTVCSEPVDATAHIWNDGTVAKEPTCNTAGLATYQCTVCEYEKEKILPATKAHNYVNGVCSVCGKVETDCIHQKISAADVDLTGWDLCEGARIIKYSCECGENTYFDWRLPCNFADESEIWETIEYEGQQVTKLTRICTDCGLSISYFQFYKMQENACAGNMSVCFSFAVPGQEALVGIQSYGYERLHPITKEVQTVSLKEYGLCTETLSVVTCSCGEITAAQTLESCEWKYTGKNETYICAKCGAVKTEAYAPATWNGCYITEQHIVTYYVDDVQVYTYTSEYIYAEHNYKATSWELFGQSCVDGILVDYTCSDCGKTHQNYTDYHERIIEEEVDLSGFDICSDSVILASCACEERYQSYYFNGESGCSWMQTGCIEETSEIIYTCRFCGARRIWKEEAGLKDENCIYLSKVTDTYLEADGTLIFTGIRTYTNEDHDYETWYTMKGESCEDGVTIQRICRDCGVQFDYTVYYHESFALESYDLADYGTCGGQIQIWGCACGEQRSCNWDDNCNWQQIGGAGDENFEQYIFVCDTCESYYDYIVERKTTDDICVRDSKITYRFYKDLENPDYALTVSWSRYTENHDMLATFELKDAALGCAGGFTIFRSCQNCDHTEQWESSGNEYHEPYLVDKGVYSSDKLCGDIIVWTYSCPCGQRSNAEYNLWENGCNWEYRESETGWYYICHTCGTLCDNIQSSQKVEGETCRWLYVKDVTFANEGEELFAFRLAENRFNHRYVYTFELEGETCNDGFYAYGTCLDCGEMAQTWDSGCYTYPVEREIVANDPNACGPVDIVRDSCPCGKETNSMLSAYCSWDWQGFDKNGAEIYQCHTCGMVWKELRTSARIPGTCQYNVTQTGEFILGENTYSYERTYVELEHKTVYKYNLLGDSCEDGVEVTRACAYCDYEGDSWTDFDHDKRTVAYYNLADYGMCGGYVSHSSCGCGKESSWGWSVSDCDFMSTGTIDPDTNDTVWFCRNCENYICWGNDGELNTETCTFAGAFYFKLRKADDVLLNLRGATSTEQHTTYVLSQELLNPNGDCDDGVKRYWQCQYCDEGWYSTSYGHGYVETQSVEAPCGGKIRYMSCACGKNVNVYVENNCEMSHEYYEETDENGIVHRFTDRTCETCGLNILNEWYDIPLENCIDQRNEIYTITVNGEQTVYRYTREETAHRDVVYTSTLAPGSESCEDGIVVSRTCAACGEAEIWFDNYHRTNLTEKVDLAELGGCGGTVEIYSCACGRVQDMNMEYGCNITYDSWETTGENGVVYEHTLQTCSECGLKLQSIRHKEATDTLCVYKYYTNTTLTIGDSQWSVQSSYAETDHDYRVTYSLLEGSVTCDDGVLCVETCAVCGISNSWQSNYHGRNLVESVDLSQYSSVCGGYLNISQCPCGESLSYDFAGDDRCDFDSNSISVWVEDAVYEYNPCVDGEWPSHYAVEYRCAVNEPEICGLVIRRANYCLKTEDCYVTEYLTWQIGYDEKTDTCQREITYELGKKQFHDYEITSLNTERGEDGTYLYGTRYLCKNCQSEYYYCSQYNGNNEMLWSESVYRNTLNDGCDQYRRHFETYEVINGYNYEVCERWEYTYADGTQYWYQYEYLYYPESCSRAEVYTNSNGEKYEYTYEWHQYITSHSESKSDTCSQPGWYHGWDVCDRCGKTTWENSYTYTPGHCWHWDSGLDTYYCCDCGLHNTSGADGDIIMEDLTEEYGNDTDYVVGYYNPNEHMFVANVSVVLDNAEGDDNLIDLGITDITYYDYDKDGFTGLSVNKQTALTAAEQAVAALDGYKGTYAIRISFVPISSHFTLDYAITFDSVTA